MPMSGRKVQNLVPLLQGRRIFFGPEVAWVQAEYETSLWLLFSQCLSFSFLMCPLPIGFSWILSLINHLHLNPWYNVCFWVTRARTLYWPTVQKEGIKERRKNRKGGREGRKGNKERRKVGRKEGRKRKFLFFAGKQLRNNEDSCFAINSPALDFQLSHFPAI